MSYVITIHCQSDEPLTRNECSREIKAGVFFENEPTFDPPIGSEAGESPDWDKFVITYASDKRPIVVRRGGAIKGIGDDLGQDFSDNSRLPELRDRIVNAQQVYALDVDQSGLTDEAWEMCDFLEKFIAQRLNCLIYAPGDGIYDSNLHALVRKSGNRG